MMKRLVNLLTKRHEVFRPPFARPIVGIFGVELKPIPVRKAIQHGIDHVVQLNEETTVNACMIDKSPMKGFVHLFIVTNFHRTYFVMIIFFVSISCPSTISEYRNIPSPMSYPLTEMLPFPEDTGNSFSTLPLKS